MDKPMRYSIKQISEMLGLPYSTLHYWEETVPQFKPIRTATNRRYYTDEHIQLAKRIKYMREKQDLSLDRIVTLLQNENKAVDRRQKAVEYLQEVRNELQNIIKQL